MERDAELEAAIFDLLAQRREGKSICPSEAPRRVCPADWRPLMDATRRIAAELAERGRLEVTQKGQPVHAGTARGPIRLRLPSQ